MSGARAAPALSLGQLLAPGAPPSPPGVPQVGLPGRRPRLNRVWGAGSSGIVTGTLPELGLRRNTMRSKFRFKSEKARKLLSVRTEGKVSKAAVIREREV